MRSVSVDLVRKIVVCGFAVLGQIQMSALAASKPATDADDKSVSSQTGAAPFDEARKDALVKQLWAKYERLGTAAFKKNDMNLSLEFIGQALQEAELIKDKRLLAHSLDSLAVVYQRLGKPEDGLKAAKNALELHEQLGWETAQSKAADLLMLGNLFLQAGDSANANTYLQQALKVADSDAAAAAYKSKIMDSLHELAPPTAAEEESYLVGVIRQDKARPTDLESASHLEQYARILWQKGQLNEAKNCLEQALSIRSSRQKSSDPQVIVLNRNLIRAKLMLGATDGIDKDISTVLEFDRAHLAPNAQDYLFDLLSLAQLKFHKGESAAASELCQEVLAAQKDLKQENSLEMADASSLMAQLSAAAHQWYESNGSATRACQIRQSLGLPQSLSITDYETIARVAAAQGQWDLARSNFQKALVIRQNQFAGDKDSIAKVKDELEAVNERVAKAKIADHLSEQVPGLH